MTIAGLTAAVGTAGDAEENALADTVNGLYNTELGYARSAWRAAAEGELDTMNWVHWWNTIMVHQALDYQTLGLIEASYHMPQDQAPSPV